MNIVEALKLSNKVRRTVWIEGSYLTFSDGVGTYDFHLDSMLSYDWEPVLPEKKTVTKKFYQALFQIKKYEDYLIPECVFEKPEQAESFGNGQGFKLIRFLVENPIEVEIEETK